MPRANKWEAMGGPELHKIMQDWPFIMRQATDTWAQTFAADIWKHAGNGKWRPTLKQARVMRRLLRELERVSDDVTLTE